MRKSAGFSLIELLTVMSIAGIMAAIAAPQLQDFIAKQRVKSAAYEVVTSLMIAHSEAIKRNNAVAMTPSGGWTDGWALTTTQTISGTATTITLHNQQSVGGVDFNLSPASVNFDKTGRPTTAANCYASTSVCWEITRNTHTRCVRLSSAGTASSTETSCPTS